MTKQRPASIKPPKDVDLATGLPARDAPIGVSVSASPEREAAAMAFAVAAARSLHDDKCEDVLVLDLRGQSQMTDFFVIGSGTSERQMRAAAQHVADIADGGLDLYRSNLAEKDQSWVVMDFVDVVTHVLTPEARLYYDIEMLWGDAPRIEWQRGKKAASPSDIRNRAGLRPGDLPPDAD